MSKDPRQAPPGIMTISYLAEVMAKIEGRVKHIHENALGDPKFIPAMETVEMMLQVINHYATWVRELREEMIKCDAMNKHQAEMINNMKGIKLV